MLANVVALVALVTAAEILDRWWYRREWRRACARLMAQVDAWKAQ